MNRFYLFVIFCLVSALLMPRVLAGPPFRYPPVGAMVEASDVIIIGTVQKTPTDDAQKYSLWAVKVEEVLNGTLSGPPKGSQEKKFRAVLVIMEDFTDCDPVLWEEGKYLLFLKIKEVQFVQRTQQRLRENGMYDFPRYSVVCGAAGHGAFLLSNPRKLPAYKFHLELVKRRPEVYGTGEGWGKTQPRRLREQYGIKNLKDYLKAVKEFIRISRITDKLQLLEELSKVKDKGKVHSESVAFYLRKFRIDSGHFGQRENLYEIIDKLGDNKREVREGAQQQMVKIIDKYGVIFDRLLLYLKWRSCTAKEDKVKEGLELIIGQALKFGLTSSLLEEMPGVFRRLISPDARLRMNTLKVLVKSKNPDAIKPLIKLLDDKAPHIRKAAAEVLKARGYKKSHERKNETQPKTLEKSGSQETEEPNGEEPEQLKAHAEPQKKEPEVEPPAERSEEKPTPEPVIEPETQPEPKTEVIKPERLEPVERPEAEPSQVVEEKATDWPALLMIVAIVVLAGLVLFLLLRRRK